MTPDKISEFQAASVGTLINWANNDWYVAGIDGTKYKLLDSNSKIPDVSSSTLSSCINSSSSSYEPVTMNTNLETWWNTYKTANADIQEALSIGAILDNEALCDALLPSAGSFTPIDPNGYYIRSTDKKFWVASKGEVDALPQAARTAMQTGRRLFLRTYMGYENGSRPEMYTLYNGQTTFTSSCDTGGYTSSTYEGQIMGMDLDIGVWIKPKPRWLVKHNDTLYHVDSGSLAAIPTTDLSQATFATYGTEDAPTSDMQVPLDNPTIYLCGLVDSDGRVSDPKTIHAAISAYPPAQTLETQIDLSDASIRGIIDAVGEYENGTQVSTSYDGTTWTTPILLSDWIANTDYNALFNGLGTDELIHFRFTLDGNATFTRLKVNFNNERSQ